MLATGAFLKNAICVTRGDEAFLSQHIGDLDNAPAHALGQVAAHLLAVLDVTPDVVAHDLHPDFYSTRFAAEFARERDIPVVAVQHHHAHVAAVAAEHGVVAPVLGLALDGVGIGPDGGAWGGELLHVERSAMRRIGHLRELPLPGGDRAAQEPWRMAAAVLHLLGRDDEILSRFDRPAAATIRQMLQRGSTACSLQAPAAGSMLRQVCSPCAPSAPSKDKRQCCSKVSQIDTALLRHSMPDGRSPTERSICCRSLRNFPCLTMRPTEPRSFISTLAAALAQWTVDAAHVEGITTVVLGGGCFMNRILTTDLRERLERAGLRVLEAHQAPPNDGGLARTGSRRDGRNLSPCASLFLRWWSSDSATTMR